VNGDTIRADAQDPGLKAETIQALAGELEGDSQKVASQLSGDITADVQANPKTASATAKTLAAKGHYAVGLISSFAGMVDTFDSTVNNLNHRYKTDLASAMRYAGQAAAATKDKADDAKVTEADMGPAIKANLQPEYKAAMATLDDDADSIAAKFKRTRRPTGATRSAR
jgi:membrane protease subunit (stomatin/prohibitin family)